MGKYIFLALSMLILVLIIVLNAIATLLASHSSKAKSLTATIQEEKIKFGTKAAQELAQRLAPEYCSTEIGNLLSFRASRLLESEVDTPEKMVIDCLECIASRYRSSPRGSDPEAEVRNPSRDKLNSVGRETLKTLDKFRALEKSASEATSSAKLADVQKVFDTIKEQAAQILFSLREKEKTVLPVTEEEKNTFRVEPTISALFAPTAKLLPAQ